MLKRVISFLLCLSILFSMLPVHSFATEDYTESTGQIVETEPVVEKTTAPTEAVTEPAEEITALTESAVEVTEPETTTEPEPVCTGLVDCPVSDHDDSCEKKVADEKAEADQNAADAVEALIDAMPSLDEIKSKELDEQAADYNQVQAVYNAYENLTADQKALLPVPEQVFQPYFDYFNSLIAVDDVAAADNACGENLTWDLEDGVLTISGTGTMTDYAVASDVPWYGDRGQVQNVVIENGVTTIGDRAFYNCTNLCDITFGTGVQVIGTYAFRGCTALEEITLPSNVTELKDSAFRACTALKTVTFGGNAPTTGNYVFNDGAVSMTVNCYEGSTDFDVAPWTNYTVVYNHVGQWIVESLPTCTTEGSMFFYCSYCNDTFTKIVPPYEHNYVDGICSECQEIQIIASGSCGYNVTWQLTVTGQLRIRGTGYIQNYDDYSTAPWYKNRDKIQSVVIEEGVTSIGTYAFYECGRLSTIHISDSVSGIGKSAFHGCSSLTGITIPEGVRSVVEGVFAKCSSLTDICIPESVTYIRDYAFSDCSSLKEIVIPESVTHIGKYAFDNCSSLTDLSIPEGVTSIGACAFSDCSSLTEIRIPDSVTTIEQHVFIRCSSLTEIYIPDSVTTIKQYAFYGCSSLPEIMIPESVTSIGDFAFGDCSSLTEIIIPESVTSISSCAFYDCSSLTKIAIPESITIIGSWTFAGCRSLMEFTIPESITSIGQYAFECCSSLTQIKFCGNAPAFGTDVFYSLTATAYYPTNNPTWTSDVMQNYGGTITWVPYSSEHVHEYDDNHVCECGAIGGTCSENLTWVLNDEGTLTISGEGAMTDYYVDGTTPPPWDALRNEIISLVIEDGVTSIGECAFSVCTNLQSIDFGQISTIGRHAFGSCESLSGELVFPDSVTYIGKTAFSNCRSLTSVTIPGSVTSIMGDTFRECYSITEITFIGMTAPSPCGLGRLTSLKDIYVPGESIEAYMASISVDGPYAAIQAVDSQITQGTCGENLTWFFDETTCALTISGTGAMRDFKPPYGAPWSSYGHQSKIVTVVIEDGITSIGDYAFRYCDNLGGNLVIPDSVTSLGKSAFYDCGSIDVTIGNGLKEIPAGAFSNSGITTIDFGAITAIGDYAFSNCDGLDGDLVIPNTIISMGSSVFEDCDGIDTLTLGNGLTVLPFGAFMSCDDLKSIDIGNITVIPSAAFSGCKSLTSIDLKNVTSIEPEAFSGCDSLVELLIPDTVTTIYSYGFGECKNLASVTLGSGLTALGVDWTIPFHDCTGLTEITFTGNTVPAIAGDFTSLTALETVYVPAESLEAYATALNGLLPANAIIQVMTPNRLILDSEAFSGYDSVWIDGAEMTIQKDGDSWYIDLPNGNARVMTTYTYHIDDTAEDGVDSHRRYPVGMRVWTLENQNGVYSATRQNAFDDILQYAGISIRITGKQGIRMITSIAESNKDALTGNGLVGYTLKEYGTAIAWAGQLSSKKPLVLGKSHVSSNYAYKQNVADPIFNRKDGRMQYTNVLVGFNLDQCKNDIAMRSYMILADAEGNEITIYGGIVERSIGYIALRNRFRYPNYSDYYGYVWEIIHAVYGNAYDADWHPEWTDTIM